MGALVDNSSVTVGSDVGEIGLKDGSLVVGSLVVVGSPLPSPTTSDSREGLGVGGQTGDSPTTSAVEVGLNVSPVS